MPCHQLVSVARSLHHSIPSLGHGILRSSPELCFSQVSTLGFSVPSTRRCLCIAGGVGFGSAGGRRFSDRFCGSSKRGVRMSSVSESPAPPAEGAEKLPFGPYRISSGEIFFRTKLSFAFVNLRPVVPDLSSEEVTDLWHSAQTVGKKLEPFFGGSSLTLAIQDGPEAGQTVPHVHVHILPRKKADFKNNDEIYDEIDKKEKELKDNLDLDEERKDRPMQEMHEEAAKLRKLF